MFQECLSQCATNFGMSPRDISLWDRLTYWRVVRPDWLYQRPDDELETLFLNLNQLRRNGKVVWGHFIQANSLLYAPGSSNCPAEVVFSLDDSNPIHPEELHEVARTLGSLKHTTPYDPDLASIADYLTSEWTRVYGKPVPRSISPQHPCQISTIYIVRKHLPVQGRFLQKPILPIVVNPTTPHVALALPSRYWPVAFTEWWLGGKKSS